MPASEKKSRVRKRTALLASAPTVPTAATTTVGCGCGIPHDDKPETNLNAVRKAVAVDADAKRRNQQRLRRIEGQIRGLEKMVADDRYCVDILTQIASVHEALRAVGRELMRNHLKHCTTEAIKRGPEDAEAIYDELVGMMYKHSR